MFGFILKPNTQKLTKGGYMMQDKKIEYVLIASVDEIQVFRGHYADTYEVQENGLSDAEDVVSAYLEPGDLEPEEMAYIQSVKNRIPKSKGAKMNRDCLVVLFGVLVHSGTLSRAAADYYLKILDKKLEDGDTLHTIGKVLEAFNG